MPASTLTSLIQRAGGASIRAFRQELIVARLAAIAEAGVTWPLVAELLGVPRAGTVIA